MEDLNSEDIKLVTAKQVIEIVFKAFRDLDISIDLSDYVTKEELEQKLNELKEV